MEAARFFKVLFAAGRREVQVLRLFVFLTMVEYVVDVPAERDEMGKPYGWK